MKKIIMYNNEETNYEVSDDGKIYNRTTGKELKGTYKTNEYHSIQLKINNKLKTFMVHRLVAEAFCPNPNNYIIVDHINQNKHDERAENLRWVTQSENSKNSIRLPPRPNRYYEEDFDENWKPTFINSNYMINKDTALVVNIKTRKIMVPQERNGYYRIHLGTNSLYSLHIILWLTFVGPIEEGMEIDHIDGNKKNNALGNLRKVTRSENMKNAYKNNHANAVAVYQFDKNGEFIKKYDSCEQAAKMFGVSEQAIKYASLSYGLSCNYYWLREKDKDKIDDILVRWIPEGYKIIPGHCNYCINKNGDIFNKRTRRNTPVYYLADGVTKMTIISRKKCRVDTLINKTFIAL